MVANAMLMNTHTALTARSVASRKPFVSGRHAQKMAQITRAGDPAAPDEGPVAGEIIDFAKTLPGISQPFPNIFDPADFLGNAKDVDDVRRWRESELVHGRVAMLASLGFIAQEQLIDWPQSPFPHVEGAAIGHFQQVEAKGAIFWEPLVFAIGLAEAYRITIGWANPKSTGFNKLEQDYIPGDLGFDPLNLYPSDPKAQYDIKTKELNNGRLAMIAIAAFVAQELRVQKPIFENAATAVGAA